MPRTGESMGGGSGEVENSREQLLEQARERASNIWNEGGNIREFIDAAEAVVPDFNLFDLFQADCGYSEEQLREIINRHDAAVAAREAAATTTGQEQTPPVEQTPAPAPAPASEGTSTTETPAPAPAPAPASEGTSTTETPASDQTSETGGDNGSERQGRLRRIGRRLAVAGVAAALALGAFGMRGGRASNGGEVATESVSETPGDETDETAAATAEAGAEQAESLDVSDNYRNHFANEDGTEVNPNKKNKVSYGEALEHDDARDYKEDYKYIAQHEAALFAPYYCDLPDELKIEGTEDMGIDELTKLMVEDEDMHRKMAQLYCDLLDDERTTFEFVELNGDYVNVYATTDAKDGEPITSANTRAVYCISHLNGSKAVKVTITYGSDGGSGGDSDGGKYEALMKNDCGAQLEKPRYTPGAEKIQNSTQEIKDPDLEPKNPGGGPEEEQDEDLAEKSDADEEKTFKGEEGDGDHFNREADHGAGSADEDQLTEESTTEEMGESYKGDTEEPPKSEEAEEAVTQTETMVNEEAAAAEKAEEAAREEVQEQANDDRSAAEEQAATYDRSEEASEADADDDGKLSYEEVEALGY